MTHLSVGMTKNEVLEYAKNLPLKAQTKVAMFFRYDKDGIISHENELAILNSLFDGSGKVKMPKTSAPANLNGNMVSNCSTKNSDGTTSYSLLYDEDNDGYADGHNMGEFKVNGRISTGWHGKDNNLDGVAERKGNFRANLDNISDPNNIEPNLDNNALKSEHVNQWKNIDVTY